MTRTGQNTTIYKGDHKTIQVTVLDSGNNAVNLTASTMNYVVYKQNTGTIVITKTTASGISLTAPAGGILEISLVPADTENLYIGAYQHELEMTDVSGQVSTLLTGSFTILDSKA